MTAQNRPQTPDLTCAQADELLADWFEGTLPRELRQAMQLHLSSCLRCAALVRDLDGISAAAAALPPLTPSRDLWSGIASRIDEHVVAAPNFTERRDAGSTGRARLRPWMPRLAAAAALVAATAGITYFSTRATLTSAPVTAAAPTVTGESSATAGNPSGAPVAASIDTLQTGTNRLASNTPAMGATRPGAAGLPSAPVLSATSLDREISTLRGILDQRREELEPATVAVLENSLTTIDRAIAEARAALARDPASTFLSEQLQKTQRRKLELLRMAALLPART